MRPVLRVALLLAPFLSAPMLSGCASTGAELASAVPADLTTADAAPIAAAMADLTTRRVQASSGAIRVQAPPGDAVLTPVLVHTLRAAGYTVADTGPHRLSYRVNALGRDLLVLMDLDGARAARLFTRAGGRLAAAGAFTVREREVVVR